MDAYKEEEGKTQFSTEELGVCLQGLRFPAEKHDVVQYARSKHCDENIIKAIDMLPNRSYDGFDDVETKVGEQIENEIW